MITPKEFAEMMNEVKTNYKDDKETCHAKMDDILCMVLIDLGYEDGVMTFLRTSKWYS